MNKRRQSNGIEEGSIDDFMNKMGLGDPDPSNHRTGFEGADEIVDWFQRDSLMTGDNVTKLNIAKNLVEKIEDLLDGKHITLSAVTVPRNIEKL